MEKVVFYLILLVSVSGLKAQPLKDRQPYNISKDRVLYTIGYAHLDTEWNWDYPATINQYIRATMEDNFKLFGKYPDYVFNFTGSRRYEMMKEYYPDLYKKVASYIQNDRWYVSGSSVDEGEVNISSSESVIRQVLYGNRFFKKEFGKESCDYMLPDCFGFLSNLPSIWHHCGLLGFSTQKLTWRSANGVPFNLGVWNGPDSKGVIAALNATEYTGTVVPRLDNDSVWNARIDQNKRKYDISFDYRYYGVGDCGGAPRENDVKNAIGSLRNENGKLKVVLTSSDQMYKDITPEIRQKLPVYSGDLLLIEHSAGSLTSQAYMKRANRKNELLAQSAEQIASIADWMGGANYPFNKLNRSWNLVLGSQFHDILPGTSIPKAYEYAWNDEFIAANGFSEVLKNSVGRASHELDTRVKGKAVVVYNPVARSREDIVTAKLEYDQLPAYIQVLDPKGKVLPSQIIGRKDHTLELIFLAKIPSVGLAVFDVREAQTESLATKNLKVTNQSLENDYYRVKFDLKGDLVSIVDKKISKELLRQPARLEFQKEEPEHWPAWNMDWKDRQMPPFAYVDQDASINVIEDGPVRVAIQINRKGRNSEINQIFSLAAGDAGKRLEVTNKIDWQSKGVSLKAAFPLDASDEKATYNLGVGTIERATNNETKYEVPSKEWIDLTDSSGKYGVTVLEDCKYGSDKPDSHTLRLTLLYTPRALQFVHQNSQDWGIHDFRYGLYAHQGNWAKGLSAWQGKFFNQPLLAFEAPKHDGSFGTEWSALIINDPGVGLMALKKMEEGDYYLVRVNELLGKDTKNVRLSFAGKITEAFEVNGQEQRIGNVDFTNDLLHFDLSHFTIRSFAVKLKPLSNPLSVPRQFSVKLPYNGDAMSFDSNRSDGNIVQGLSMPAELIPDKIVSEDISFEMGSRADYQMNMVECQKQTIELPQGDYNSLYILAAATDDTQGDFGVDGHLSPLNIQKWTGYTGQFYNRQLTADNLKVTGISQAFVKSDNIAWFASHRHQSEPSSNEAYQYSYMFKYRIDIPKNAKRLALPDNPKIKIYAVTISKAGDDTVKLLQPLYDHFSDHPKFNLRNQDK